MELVTYLIHFLFLFFIFKSLIGLFQNNLNTDSNSKNKHSEALEATKTPTIEKFFVKDFECNREIDKSKAYIIVNNEQEYYFCSWDCRNKYLLKHGQA
ncbi:MAG: hypothetical protein VR72_17615 [Clostridiaceae bacterium BRH_c20a]|nr:MAG: hypothetical protein VR72_17615 [Clostridiaceae bacterium BRH_c20a]